MQLSTIILATLAAVVSASPAARPRADCPAVDKIPVCGYSCILAAVADIGCQADDYACMCSKFSSLEAAAASCVITNCGLTGAPAVLSAAQAVCDTCA